MKDQPATSATESSSPNKQQTNSCSRAPNTESQPLNCKSQVFSQPQYCLTFADSYEGGVILRAASKNNTLAQMSEVTIVARLHSQIPSPTIIQQEVSNILHSLLFRPQINQHTTNLLQDPRLHILLAQTATLEPCGLSRCWLVDKVLTPD